MEIPRPGEPHRQLERLCGHWVGEETLHPSPCDPHGGKAQSSMELSTINDGFAVRGDYVQQREGAVRFSGHAVYTWEPDERRHVLYWFDCKHGPPNVFRGGFDGDVLTLTCVRPQGYSRLVYDLSEPGRLLSRMELSLDGQTWAVFMDGHFVRAD